MFTEEYDKQFKLGRGMGRGEELEAERQESERHCGMMRMKLDRDNFRCQLLAFWKKENKKSRYENYCISLT